MNNITKIVVNFIINTVGVLILIVAPTLFVLLWVAMGNAVFYALPLIGLSIFMFTTFVVLPVALFFLYIFGLWSLYRRLRRSKSLARYESIICEH